MSWADLEPLVQPIEHALIIPTGSPVDPFPEAPGRLRVLDRPLAQVQAAAVAQVGLKLVKEPPADRSYLVISDRTWVTSAALRCLLDACAGQPGRLRVSDADFLAGTSPLQDLAAPGLYEVAVLPAGPPSLDRAPPLDVDLHLEDAKLPTLHPRMQHVARPIRLGAAMVHQLDHWSHLVRVNQLALAARALSEKAAWDRSPWWRKVWRAMGVLLRARSLNGYALGRALCEIGRDVDIHPTATVEVSVLGDGVKIGPHAVVRASVLGDGAVIDDHASVNVSVVGAQAHVGRFAMVNLATLLPRAWVSWCNGTQASIIGEEAFIAWGATLLDLSFGGPIKVQHRGARVDSGQHFLGVAIGHRAVLAHDVKINYGVAVPCDAVLVAGADGLLRAWGDAPTGVPCRVQEGVAMAVKRRTPTG
ncbi:MAG: hypothetical protein GXP62_01340 [Oligoflexia bacterium]|nr:hypothetical protein [Oligoflexia bacterium]